jgi:hypothetical protein
MGACERWGQWICAADGLSLVCSAEPGPPTEEICNGIDDDCDGLVDEGALCPPVTNGTSECVGGACVVSCSEGYDHCTSDPTDGCETAILDDAWNCGGCGGVCPLAETIDPGQICVSGVCVCFGDDDCASGQSCIDGAYPHPGYCS